MQDEAFEEWPETTVQVSLVDGVEIGSAVMRGSGTGLVRTRLGAWSLGVSQASGRGLCGGKG